MSKTAQQAGADVGAGVLPTAQEITSVSTPQAAQAQVGDKLARDIQSIMGEGAKLVQEDQTLTTNAAKRVAIDNLNQMSIDLTAMEANRTPDMDNRDFEKANEAIYQHYGNQIFDNEDAQRAFDDMYHQQGAATVAKRNAVLEKDQNKKDAIKNFDNISQAASDMMRGGVAIDHSTYNTMVEIMTAGGYYTKEQAQFALADRSTTAFDSKLTSNLREVLVAGGYDATQNEGAVTEQIKSNVFANNFSAYGKYNADSAEIEWKDDIDNKTREEILRAWGIFKDKTDSSGGLNPFKRLQASVTQRTSTTKGNYIPPSVLAKQLEEDNASFMTIQQTDVYTETQEDNMKIKLEEATNELTMTQIVAGDLSTGSNFDANNIRTYLKKGKSVSAFDARLKKTVKTTIPASRYKNAANYYLNSNSKAAMGTDVSTPEGEQQFKDYAYNTMMMEGVTGTDSALTAKYEGASTSGKVQTLGDINSATQATLYADVALQWDKKNEVAIEQNEEAKAVLKDNKLDDKQKLAIVNIQKQSSKNDASDAVKRLDIKKQISTRLNELREGSDVFGFDATISAKTETAITKAIYQAKRTNDVEGYIGEIEGSLMDMGSTFFGDKDERFVHPLGVSEEETRKALGAIIDEENRVSFKQYDEEDYKFENEYKQGNYVIMITNKETGKILEEVNIGNVFNLSTKGK